jgi:hypothetical protein
MLPCTALLAYTMAPRDQRNVHAFASPPVAQAGVPRGGVVMAFGASLLPFLDLNFSRDDHLQLWCLDDRHPRVYYYILWCLDDRW